MIDDAVRQALQYLSLRPGAGLHVVVNDPDRSTPTGAVLSALCAQRPDLVLEGTVACGTHRHTREQRRAHITRHGLERLQRLSWSGPEGDTELAPEIGVLGIGSVEPHWFAGWTGAHKTLTVGLWSRSRIEANHAYALSPEARPARLEGNPIFEDLECQLRAWIRGRSGPVAAVQLVADGGGIHAAVGGRVVESLRAIVEEARPHYVERVDGALDRLVARVEPPLDRSLYQASKGIKNSSHAVRDGGAMVLVAECAEGVGIGHFVEALKTHGSHAEMVEKVAREGYRLGDHKAVRLRHLTDVRGLHLAVVASGLPEDAARWCGMRAFATEDAVLSWARRVAPGERERVLSDAGQRVIWL